MKQHELKRNLLKCTFPDDMITIVNQHVYEVIGDDEIIDQTNLEDAGTILDRNELRREMRERAKL